ncbi:hypothetical protein TKK_0010544 [Trichogramma kaykai]
MSLSRRKRRERKYDRLLKKLHRLGKKVKKHARRRSSSSSSSSSQDTSNDERRSRDQAGTRSRSRSPVNRSHSKKREHSTSRSVSRSKRSPRDASTLDGIDKSKRSEHNLKSTSPTKSKENTDDERGLRGTSRHRKDNADDIAKNPDENKSTDKERAMKVDENNEFIELLGDDALEESADGPPIHDKLAEKWSKILKLGLPKDVKQALLKKHEIPSNCLTLKAPILNEEVKPVLTIGQRKDLYQATAQNQLGIAISILGKSLTQMMEMENKKEVAEIFERVSDA